MRARTRQLDTRIEIVTPENIAFEYHLAGPFRRLLAYCLDFGIRVALLGLLAIALVCGFGLAQLPGLGIGMLAVAHFVLDWFYGGLFETFWNGQTPGKRLLRTRVTSITGQPIHAWQAVLRNILRAADGMPVIGFFPTFQVGLFAAAANERFQRLGDLASGTMVVVEDPQRLYGVTPINEPQAIQLAAFIPARFRVNRSLARALSDYVQRRQAMPLARRAEIARHVGEILRVKFDLPPGVSHDLLLCALYYRAFIADRPEEEEPSRNPFQASSNLIPPLAVFETQISSNVQQRAS